MSHSVSLRKSVRHNSAMLIIHPQTMKCKLTCTSILAGNCFSAKCLEHSNVDWPTSVKVSAKLWSNLYPLIWQLSLPLQLQGEVEWNSLCLISALFHASSLLSKNHLILEYKELPLQPHGLCDTCPFAGYLPCTPRFCPAFSIEKQNFDTLHLDAKRHNALSR